MKKSYAKLDQVENLLEIIADFILLIDSDFKIIDSNEALNLIIKDFDSLRDLTTKESIIKLHRKLVNTSLDGKKKPFDFKMHVKNKTLWISGYLIQIQEDQYLLYGQEITKTKSFELELLQRNKELENIKIAILNLLEDMTETQDRLKGANKKLKEVDVLKNEFIAIASHELRTPMTSIKGYLSMILDGDAGKINGEVRSYLEEVFRSNERLVELVNDMLNVSRIEQNRMIFNIENINALSVLTESYERMKPLSKKEQNKLVLITDIPKQLEIKADFKKYQQIVQNLIENAIKFTDKGEISITASVDKNFLITSVKDHGIGISPEEQKNLFQKFYQVASVLNRSESGSGLGLYIAKNFVKGMGGKIFIKSKLGSGSTFSFTIPIVKETLKNKY